jgi:TonB-dependent SusC/RagA subfamily outer membrane receptor
LGRSTDAGDGVGHIGGGSIRQTVAVREDIARSPVSSLERPARLTVHDVPLETALIRLYESSGVPVTFSPSRLPRDHRVSCKCESLLVKGALELLLQGTPFRYRAIEGNIVVFDIPRAPNLLDRRSGVQLAAMAPPSRLLQSRPIEVSAVPRASQHQVTGRVTDATTGAPVAGVQIAVRGTTTGTISNQDGRYILQAPSADATLVFTSIGYAPLEVLIEGRSVLDVELTPHATELEELVVIGYGERRRATLTESVGTVSAQEIARVPVVSADHALQGRVSGVHITSAAGVPGAPVAVRIRGVSTVGNSQPLFVIDGVPVGRGEGWRTNPLATINPADIESISVLKDASAAAVYGVQAANGVVLIQTKRGRLGKPTLRYDGYSGREVFTSLPHPQYVVGCSRPAIAADTLKEFPRGCVLGVNGSFEEAVEEQASGA